MPCALREFSLKPRVAVVGFSEYVFTERWNLVARVAALNERTFNTTVQRGLGMLGMRFVPHVLACCLSSIYTYSCAVLDLITAIPTLLTRITSVTVVA